MRKKPISNHLGSHVGKQSHKLKRIEVFQVKSDQEVLVTQKKSRRLVEFRETAQPFSNMSEV